MLCVKTALTAQNYRVHGHFRRIKHKFRKAEAKRKQTVALIVRQQRERKIHGGNFIHFILIFNWKMVSEADTGLGLPNPKVYVTFLL